DQARRAMQQAGSLRRAAALLGVTASTIQRRLASALTTSDPGAARQPWLLTGGQDAAARYPGPLADTAIPFPTPNQADHSLANTQASRQVSLGDSIPGEAPDPADGSIGQLEQSLLPPSSHRAVRRPQLMRPARGAARSIWSAHGGDSTTKGSGPLHTT